MGAKKALFLKVRPLMVMGWKSLGRVSFLEKSDWRTEGVCDRVLEDFGDGAKTHRRVGSTDRWFLEREELVDVGIGFVDESHSFCSSERKCRTLDDAR